jgi:hypothetical protein
MSNGVEGICDVHLNHDIKMDVWNSVDTMNHNFTPTPNIHTKLM